MFQMNATSRKILQKVLMGFIITELNKRGHRIKRRCPGTKRVRGGEDLRLGAIEQTNRERDRQAEKYQHIKIKDKEKKMVRMHEKCMRM